MRKLLLIYFFTIACINCFSQTTVSGKIIDERTGTAIEGATVKTKQGKDATVSGRDGTFTLHITSAEKTIVISFVGYTDKEIDAISTFMNIALTPSARSLNEVVVVGYGTTTKRKITGNIAKVRGEDIENITVPNFTQALQGRAAGVFVESNSGKVGEGVKIRIRGAGSLSASNDPLYVVDGIPINSNSSYSGNPLADINFNDIESFDILKDASAKAIYGARGSNGVVIITTKKGKAGKTTIEVNSQYGFNRPTHLRSFLNAEQYVTLIREAARNTDIYYYGVDPLDPQYYPDSWLEYIDQNLDLMAGYSDWRKGEINTDWQKRAFNYNAKTYSFNVAASGGNEKTKFYASANYDNQDGILIGNTFRRISSRLNVDHTVSDKLKLGLYMTLSQTTAGRVPYDNEFSAPLQIVALAPITPVRDENGKIYNAPVTTYSNPLVDYYNSSYKSVSYRNIGNIYAQYNFVPSLFFRTEFGADVQNQNDEQFYGPESYYGSGIGGYGESDWWKEITYNTNNYFTFKKTYGDNDIEATAGMAYQEYNSAYANVKGQDFPVPRLQKVESAGTITGGTSHADKKTNISYFARINYQFKNRYLIYLSGREDGSSVFGNKNRYGFFPAASVGWILSEENFMKHQNFLNYLKIRASYGLTGNDDIGYYAALGLWGGSTYGGTSGLSPTQLANSNLHWEKDKEFDIGIEFGFAKNRISGEIDYYNRKTTDLLYQVPVPSASGFITQWKNIGSMQNRGVEFVLNTQNINSKNFKWTTSINISRNKNKVLQLDGTQTIIPANSSRYLNSLLVGESIGVFYGPKYAGVDPETGDALYYKEDGKEKTNDYNEAGYFIVGDPNPDWIGGITNTVSYKGIELNFLFQGVFGNQITNGGGTFMTSSFDYFDNQTSDALNRWQKPGDITNYPQLRFDGGNGTGASSRYVYDADYVRLKNISLSYKLPSGVMKRLKFQSLKIYISAVNLVTFTDYPGWDPEVNADFRAGNVNQGTDFYSAPQIKNISFGINAMF